MTGISDDGTLYANIHDTGITGSKAADFLKHLMTHIPGKLLVLIFPSGMGTPVTVTTALPLRSLNPVLPFSASIAHTNKEAEQKPLGHKKHGRKRVPNGISFANPIFPQADRPPRRGSGGPFPFHRHPHPPRFQGKADCATCGNSRYSIHNSIRSNTWLSPVSP